MLLLRPSPNTKAVQEPSCHSLTSDYLQKPGVKRLAFDSVLLGGVGNFYRWAQKEVFWDKHLMGIVGLDAFPFSLAADQEMSAICSSHDRPQAEPQGQ